MAAQRITTAEARTRGPDLDQPQNRPSTYERRRIGRPSEYGPEKVKRVAQLVNMGWSVREIADELGISVTTLYTWSDNYPEFWNAFKGGREERDERVVNALYAKAVGFDYVEQQAFKVKTGENEEAVEVVDVKRHNPADNTAMIFWLKNRRPKDWNDRQQIELSGSVELKQDDRQLALAMLDLLRGAMDAPMTIEHQEAADAAED